MRLQKFLARAGVASRRGAEELIGAGRVRVNGAAVAEMGTKVDPERDVVEVDGARVLPPAGERTVLMLHKPVGYVTTMRDAHARRIVADLVPSGRYPGLSRWGGSTATRRGFCCSPRTGSWGMRFCTRGGT